LELPQGRGEDKKFKEMYEMELEFPEGWGGLIKIPSKGEVWIFSETTEERGRGWDLASFLKICN